MKTARLSGQTILVVQDKIENAIPLQDRIVEDGGRVLTAYSLSRALLLADCAKLSGAMVDPGMTNAKQIVDLLNARSVPYIFDPAPSQRRNYGSNSELRRQTGNQRSGT